jgi:hypothetical protein
MRSLISWLLRDLAFEMKAPLNNWRQRVPLPLKLLARRIQSAVIEFGFLFVRPYFVLRRTLRRQALARLSALRPVTLFVAPEAGLKAFFASHLILARSLTDSGHAAVFLSCDGLMPMCSFKFATSTKVTAPGDRSNPACRRCRRVALVSGDRYGVVDIAIESLIGERERAEIAAILAEHPDEPWRTTYDGIAFGALAAGETLRHRRQLDISEFVEGDLRLIRGLLFSALAVYFAVSALAARYAVKRIAYIGDYAYWLPIQPFARRHGIAVTHIEHAYNFDVDRRYISLRPDSANFHMFHYQIKHWPDYRDRPIEPHMVHRIADSSIYRMRGHGGHSTFSPNWIAGNRQLKHTLGLAENRKTIVAYPSSSDELVAVREILAMFGQKYGRDVRPFPEQNEWLLGLSHWIGTRTDLQLVIRLHPRMGISHRFPSAATEYLKLQEMLANLPANVLLIKPEEKVSSYNLAEIADAVLVSWSTFGLEMARLGIPVVASYSGRGPYPTGGFIAYEETVPGYFQAVDRAVDQETTIAGMTEAFRWTNYIHWSPVVDVSDVVPSYDYTGIPRWRPPRNQPTIARVLAGGEDLSTLNMARLPIGESAEQLEREAIVATAKRFLAFLLTGENCTEPRGVAANVQSDGAIVCTIDGAVIEPHSRLARRLAAMICEFDGQATPTLIAV